jgi:polyisoprenoid-binding protein YceI
VLPQRGGDVSENAATRTIGGIDAPVPGRWEIDPAHTSIAFVAKYLMVTKVRGHFSEFSGFVQVAERPEDSGAEITIKAASIDTGNADRDKHLRSPDFLDVDRFPDLRFRSTKVELPGEDRIALTGDLTIRDVIKSVVLDAEFTGMSQDPWGNPRAGYSASMEIDREDFGASWNLALEAGGWLVSKRVQIELDVLTTLKADETPS